MNEQSLRSDMVKVCKWMYERGYIASTDGNVSARFSKERILITPSGVHKGHLTADQILLIDLNGTVIRGRLSPSSEMRMHLKVYEVRNDIGAVVHAHPPICTAFSVAGKSLSVPALTEVVLSLGEIPIAPYAAPTTAEVPQAIEPLIKDHDAIILERHGSITVGKDLSQAYNNLEKIEHAAQVYLYSSQLGGIRPLPDGEVKRLEELGEKLGLRRSSKKDSTLTNDKELIDRVVTKVIQQLRGESK